MNFSHSMAVKLSSLAFPKRIPKWVRWNCPFSSVSCAKQQFQNTPENESITDPKISISQQFNTTTQAFDYAADLSSSPKALVSAALQNRLHHRDETYYSIILKLGLNGNIREMERLCGVMVRENIPSKKDVLIALINSFVGHHRVYEAVRVIVAMNSGDPKSSVAVFNLLLGAVVEDKRDFQSVLFIYKEIVKAGIVPTVETLNHLLQALFEIDLVDCAMDQFRKMEKKGCHPNSRTYEIIITSLIVKDRVDEASAVLHEMAEIQFEPDVNFYATALCSFCWANKPEEGFRLYKMMRPSDNFPDSFLLEVLLCCLCKNLWMDAAAGVLKDIMSHGKTVTADALVEIVRGFCKLKRFEEANKLLEDNNVFETSLHNALLECCCSAGDYVMAQNILEKMSERRIADRDSWNIIIRWSCENARMGKAFEYLGRMIASSFIPDSATYSAMIVGYSKLNKYDHAIDLFHKVCAKCWVLDIPSYAELVRGLCEVDRVQKAAEVFYYMSRKRCSLQSSSFDMLIKGLCMKGNVNKAIRLLPLAHYSCTLCTSATYNSILFGLSAMNIINDPLIVLPQMLVSGCMLNAETYCILIDRLIAQGRAKYCALFFNMMVSEGFLPDSNQLVQLLLCLANHSQLHRVLPAVDKIFCVSEMLNSTVFSILINGLWREGHERKAHQLLDLFSEKGWVPDVTAHGLLIGSANREEHDEKSLRNVHDFAQDNVSGILADGLGRHESPVFPG